MELIPVLSLAKADTPISAACGAATAALSPASPPSIQRPACLTSFFIPGYAVGGQPLDPDPVPTKVDDCRLSDGYVAICDFNAGEASSTFLKSTDGRYFLLAYYRE